MWRDGLYLGRRGKLKVMLKENVAVNCNAGTK
jgi:hypothetical protein